MFEDLEWFDGKSDSDLSYPAARRDPDAASTGTDPDRCEGGRYLVESRVWKSVLPVDS